MFPTDFAQDLYLSRYDEDEVEPIEPDPDAAYDRMKEDQLLWDEDE